MITVLMCEHDLWMLEGGTPKTGKLEGRGSVQRVLNDGVGRRARGGRGEKAAERSGGTPQRPEVRGAGRLFLVSLRGDGESREGWGQKW